MEIDRRNVETHLRIEIRGVRCTLTIPLYLYFYIYLFIYVYLCIYIYILTIYLYLYISIFINNYGNMQSILIFFSKTVFS